MSKRFSGVLVTVVLVFTLAGTVTGQQGRRDEVTAEGVVVAVPLELRAVRSPMDENLESLGDNTEVWMVGVDHWLHPNGAKYILVEYTHANHRELFVTDGELDLTVWKFTLNPRPKKQWGTCFSWGDRFVSTAFGRYEKLPPPKHLACFQNA